MEEREFNGYIVSVLQDSFGDLFHNVQVYLTLLSCKLEAS
jgi:hypothetical protein